MQNDPQQESSNVLPLRPVQSPRLNDDDRPSVEPKKADFTKEAQSFSFRLFFAKSELDPVFDWWWNQAKEGLAQKLVQQKLGQQKKKLTKASPTKKYSRDEVARILGNKFAIFEPLLQDLLLQCLQEKVWPDEPLFTTNFMLDEQPVDGVDGLTLACRVFLNEPASFEKPFELVVSHPRPSEENIASEFEKRMAMYLAQRSREFEKTNPLGAQVCVEEGDIAVISTQPIIEGEPWKVGTLTKNKLRVIQGGCHPDEFRQQLLGLAVGNHSIKFTLNEKFGKQAGKEVSMDLTIHSILTYQLPDWSDEIAQECSFKTLEQMREEVRKQAERTQTQAWEQKASHEVLTTMIAAADFEPLPEEWLTQKANSKFDQLLRSVKGDEQQLIKLTNTSNRDHLLFVLASQARIEACQEIALFSWGLANGMQRTKEKDLGNFKAFLRDVMERALSEAIISVN
jgi:hypothetical protein